MNVAWSVFKGFVNQKQLSVQWIDLVDGYSMKASSDRFELVCSLAKDGNDDVADFEANYKSKGNKAQPVQSAAFASKVLSNGKNLFKREHGAQYVLEAGSNELLFSIPYVWAKIIAVEVIGGETLDFASLYVLDTPVGSFSGIPNYVLNQFGFDLNIAKDYHYRRSEFDADLYLYMTIKIAYNSVSAKTVGINFILNEVK